MFLFADGSCREIVAFGMQLFGSVLQLHAPRVFLTSSRFSSLKKLELKDRQLCFSVGVSPVRFSYPEYYTAAFLMCILCCGLLFSTIITPENYTRNNRKNICKAITTLLSIWGVSVVPSFRTVQLCQQEFLLAGNCQLCQNFKRVFSAFLMKKLFRNSETFLQISDERIQLKAEACPFH